VKPKKPGALANARHEQIAQLLARGSTQRAAYTEVYKSHLSQEEREAWLKKQRSQPAGGDARDLLAPGRESSRPRDHG
jgi:hypothetical protein